MDHFSRLRDRNDKAPFFPLLSYKLLKDNLHDIIIGDENTYEDQESKSPNVDPMFDTSDYVLFTKQGSRDPTHCKEEETTSIECWEWEEIEYSEIHTNQRGDEEYH